MSLKNNPREYEDVIYATVLADGKIHVGAAEDAEGAVLRTYATDADKKAGKGKESGSKWEFIYTELTGLITKITFHEGQYGKNLQLTVTDKDDEKPVTLSLSTESNFGEDVMKKLPNINLKKEVTLAPFAFEAKGKKKRGVTITQKNKKGEDEKVGSFYYDADKKAVTNGYPEVPKPKKGGKPIAKSDWRKYFSDAREFLVEDLTERLDIKEDEAEAKANKDFNDF